MFYLKMLLSTRRIELDRKSLLVKLKTRTIRNMNSYLRPWDQRSYQMKLQASLNRLFEVRSVTKFEGSGIGLFAAKLISEQLDLDLSVSQEPSGFEFNGTEYFDTSFKISAPIENFRNYQ